jgi:aconitase A
VFFRPDEGAQYAGTYTIDLSEVEPTVALYPNPDDVVPLSERAELKFDGVFIGACTTTEEDLILAGLILQAGLAKGLPILPGKRHVVPGSLPIVERLRKMGLLEVYETAGFTRGPPGCSYCVGMAADQAGKGETWLSSQNRNFKNRMGTGSIGNITSAAVVAASSFSMSLTHPASLISDIDSEAFQQYWSDVNSDTPKEVRFVEPPVGKQTSQWRSMADNFERATETAQAETRVASTLTSRIITLEDFIDTDAVRPFAAPADCFRLTRSSLRPQWRSRSQRATKS